MRLFLLSLLFFTHLAAYNENFNTYGDGTLSTQLNSEGITFSSKGEWKVFTTPFSIFSTNVFLEPASVDHNSPLEITFSQTQCYTSFEFSTNGNDTLKVVGMLDGINVYQENFQGEEISDSFFGRAIIPTNVDSLILSTLDGTQLLIDNIQTDACSLNTYHLTNSLIAHYELENNTFDTSTHQKHAIATGSSYAEGVISKALTLNVNGTFKTPKIDSLKSISFWFYLNYTDENSILFESIEDDNTLNSQFLLNETGELSIYTQDQASAKITPIKFEKEQWYHLVVIQKAHQMKLYINGNFTYSLSIDSTPFALNSYYEIAKQSALELDNIRLYDREISNVEIDELYHTRKTFSDSFEAGKQYCINNPKACNLLPSTTEKDISIFKDMQTLKNSTFDFKWHLWTTPNGNVYLTKEGTQNPQIWQMVPETRQWKPVHNASAFDGFQAQEDIFDSVSISEDSKQITFGNVLDSAIDFFPDF